MIQVDIPGQGGLELEHLVLDFNGTLAMDGRLVAGVRERLDSLSESLAIHVVTADTFGSAQEQLAEVSCRVTVLAGGRQDLAKAEFVEHLGASTTAAIGNGRNDREMLARAGLGIAVILGEGASAEAMAAADVVCTSIADALDLLERTGRLVASLRT